MSCLLMQKFNAINRFRFNASRPAREVGRLDPRSRRCRQYDLRPLSVPIMPEPAERLSGQPPPIVHSTARLSGEGWEEAAPSCEPIRLSLPECRPAEKKRSCGYLSSTIPGLKWNPRFGPRATAW